MFLYNSLGGNSMKKIIVASDHGGYELKNNIKEYLIDLNYEVTDIGTDTKESCDYPVFANKLCERILSGEFEKGILFCGTGLGMALAANRHKGIRAVCVSDTYSAKMSREHNNSNVLTLGERVLGFGLAREIVDVWLKSEFSSGRHQKRLDMLD